MKILSKIALLGAITCALTTANADDMSQADIVKALKTGGHIIYLRHAKTETDYADQITADPNNCATQRVLSEAGWSQAQSIGIAMQANEIPVENVTSSQYCRAWQTASLAFGSYSKTADLNFEKAEEYTAEQTATMSAKVTPMLSKIPTAGKNTVIVGHDDPFEAATGIYPEPQGVAYILKPTGQGFTILGHIDPEDWANTQ